MEDSTEDSDEAYLFKRIRYEVEASLQHQFDYKLHRLNNQFEKLKHRTKILTYITTIFMILSISGALISLKSQYPEIIDNLNSKTNQNKKGISRNSQSD